MTLFPPLYSGPLWSVSQSKVLVISTDIPANTRARQTERGGNIVEYGKGEDVHGVYTQDFCGIVQDEFVTCWHITCEYMSCCW
jgi:hypothetical protein